MTSAVARWRTLEEEFYIDVAGTTSQSSDELDRGRKSFARAAWSTTFEQLTRADEEAPLGAEDLQLFATAAYMLSVI